MLPTLRQAVEACSQPIRAHTRRSALFFLLSAGVRSLTIRLRVRRLFCHNVRCERCIFTERLPGIALPWARRTQRLDARLTALAWRSAAVLACVLAPSSDWLPAATRCCGGFGKPRRLP